MKQFNLQTGKLGEEIAKEYLKKKGYKILEQNYKTKYGEIDLVCLAPRSLGEVVGQKGKELVIVEVRTKIGDLYGTPEESLTKKKLRKIWLNALAYVGRKGWEGPYRVDAICVLLHPVKQQPEQINHYENIV